MSRKSKGISGERELVHMFWNTGSWVCHRIAGSGSSKYPSPDLIASNNLRKIAIECKTTKNINIYIPKKEILALQEFAKMFGAEPWIGIKFKGEGWMFFIIEDLNETKNSYSASTDLGKLKGLLFEELIK